MLLCVDPLYKEETGKEPLHDEDRGAKKPLALMLNLQLHIKQPLQYTTLCTLCKATACCHVENRRSSPDCNDSPLGDGDAMLVGSDWRMSRGVSPMRSLANTSVA